MKSRFMSQTGFSAAVLVLLIAVVAIVGFAAYRVSTQTVDTSDSGSSAVADQPIENESDLKQAEETLNSTDLDKELDTSELDALEDELL